MKSYPLYTNEYGAKFERYKKERPADWLIVKTGRYFKLKYIGK